MVSEQWSELVLAGINISVCSSTPVSPPLAPLPSQQGPLIYRNTPKDSTRQKQSTDSVMCLIAFFSISGENKWKFQNLISLNNKDQKLACESVFQEREREIFLLTERCYCWNILLSGSTILCFPIYDLIHKTATLDWGDLALIVPFCENNNGFHPFHSHFGDLMGLATVDFRFHSS